MEIQRGFIRRINGITDSEYDIKIKSSAAGDAIEMLNVANKMQKVQLLSEAPSR